MVFLTGACSGSDAEQDRRTAHGSVNGEVFSAVEGAFDRVGQQEALLIAIPDGSGICPPVEGGPPQGDLRWLSVFLCGTPQDRTGTYQVLPGGGGQSTCEGKMAWAEWRIFSGGQPSLVPATGGTLSLSGYSDEAVSGQLSLSFGADSVEGLFEAVFCPTLNAP
jgi:hypothetical protein